MVVRSDTLISPATLMRVLQFELRSFMAGLHMYKQGLDL
jgi:hypothetical protein